MMCLWLRASFLFVSSVLLWQRQPTAEQSIAEVQPARQSKWLFPLLIPCEATAGALCAGLACPGQGKQGCSGRSPAEMDWAGQASVREAEMRFVLSSVTSSKDVEQMEQTLHLAHSEKTKSHVDKFQHEKMPVRDKEKKNLCGIAQRLCGEHPQRYSEVDCTRPQAARSVLTCLEQELGLGHLQRVFPT